MRSETGSWKTENGLQIYTRTWLPESPIRAGVVLVHGLGEHSGRYTHLASYLTEHGIAVYSFDLPGHGQSQGSKGHIPSYAFVSRMLTQFCAAVSKDQPEIPLILYGHSLGGALVLYHLLTHPDGVNAAVVTSPGLIPANPPSAATLLMARLLANILPAGTISNQLDLTGLSRDPQVVQAYRDDPLTHDRVSFALGLDLIKKGEWILENASTLSVPILLMVGSADRLVNPDPVIRFAQASPRYTTLKLWDGFYHELHNEPEKDAVFQTMLDWILSVINPKSSGGV
ncbi:MAG: alpha/beta hydrolase [Chloroflexi bacterium]|nr:alpha/beta hydrolase [Chloroflexota bacterium]